MILDREAHRSTLRELLAAAFRTNVRGLDADSAADYAHLREIDLALLAAPATDAVEAQKAQAEADAVAEREALDKAGAEAVETYRASLPPEVQALLSSGDGAATAAPPVVAGGEG